MRTAILPSLCSRSFVSTLLDFCLLSYSSPFVFLQSSTPHALNKSDAMVVDSSSVVRDSSTSSCAPVGPFVPRPFPPPALENVPLPYILDQLHNLAIHYWDKPETADCTISECSIVVYASDLLIGRYVQVVPIVPTPRVRPTRNSTPCSLNMPLTPPPEPTASRIRPNHPAGLGRRVTEPTPTVSRVTRMTSKVALTVLLALEKGDIELIVLAIALAPFGLPSRPIVTLSRALQWSLAARAHEAHLPRLPYNTAASRAIFVCAKHTSKPTPTHPPFLVLTPNGFLTSTSPRLVSAFGTLHVLWDNVRARGRAEQEAVAMGRRGAER